MGFDGNYDIWRDFIKTVKKLDRSNVMARKTPLQSQSLRIHKIDEVAAVLSSRKSRLHLEIAPMSRSEIKKFKSRKSIDLHGYTCDISETLATFCARCILDGIYEVVVITGKGRGIVRSATEYWLKSHPEFVTRFFPIQDSRGESGSFGVRLRKR